MPKETVTDSVEAPEATTILMVPPEGFGFNQQTAESNFYQNNVQIPSAREHALAEFNNVVAALEKQGIRVLILRQAPGLPDAVFPNNWFSTHLDPQGNTNVVIYPMLTPNRQAEVNVDKLLAVLQKADINIGQTIDLRNDNHILEGTGSLVLDRKNHILYALLSNRTDKLLTEKTAKLLGYHPVIFHAVDMNHHPIYHTNVMMGIADQFAVVCLECIPDENERMNVEKHLAKSNKKVITITQEQVNNMCGNVLALRNHAGEKMLVMSGRAYRHFTEAQLSQIQEFCKLLIVQIDTIETIGGGSVRCMMAEIYHK